MAIKSFLFVGLVSVVAIGLTTSRRQTSKHVLGSSKTFSRSVPADDSTRKLAQGPYIKLRSVPSPEVKIPFSLSQVLECEAGGIPPPVIYWLRNGKRIKSSKREEMFTIELNEPIDESVAILGLSFTRSKLFLDCVSITADEGIYTCVADNAFSRVSSESKVRVVKTEVSPFSSLSKECSRGSKRLGSPSRINMWSKTRLEVVGSEVQLFCRSTGFPKPIVSWIGPNGMPITTFDDRFKITNSGDLWIKDLTWSDMGGYTCIASNPTGDDHSMTFLYPTMV